MTNLYIGSVSTTALSIIDSISSIYSSIPQSVIYNKWNYLGLLNQDPYNETFIVNLPALSTGTSMSFKTIAGLVPNYKYKIKLGGGGVTTGGSSSIVSLDSSNVYYWENNNWYI